MSTSDPTAQNWTFPLNGPTASSTSDEQHCCETGAITIETWSKVLQICVTVFVSLMGIFSNTVVLMSIVWIESRDILKHSVCILAVNLAIVDLTVAGLCQPLLAVSMGINEWPFIELESCIFFGNLDDFCAIVSNITVATIAANHFLKLHNDIIHSVIFTARNAIIFCVCLWIFAATMLAVPFMMDKDAMLNYDARVSHCVVDRTAFSGWYIALLVTAAYIAPFGTLVFCYTGVYLILKRAIAKFRQKNTEQRQRYENSDTVILQMTMGKQKKKCTRTIVLMLMVYFLTNVFNVIYFIAYQVNCTWIPDHVYRVGVLMSSCRPAVNPFIYVWRHPAFAHRVSAVLRCRFSDDKHMFADIFVVAQAVMRGRSSDELRSLGWDDSDYSDLSDSKAIRNIMGDIRNISRISSETMPKFVRGFFDIWKRNAIAPIADNEPPIPLCDVVSASSF
uniref:5-hydroxytryptamine receptor 2B-like n=1 Tax=Saccoglossus kowalevskii TaxID=10224 RepID=A0ABM0M5Q1_SACKO|nr:PREDICTED: 5-hydroxytryptamine receptor 2B-like [Saccoglossus kowalevskii]